MLFWTIVKISLLSLTTNKLRSFLAMLGIIIGVGSVIAMLAIGAGAQAQVMDRMTAMGTNLLIIRPGTRGHRGVASGSSQDLTVDEARSILNNVDGIESLAPVVQGSSQVKYLSNNARGSITGTSVSYFTIRNFTVEKGRGFTEAEEKMSARVAILGPAIAETLFEQEEPLGQDFKIGNMNFEVIGILKEKGDQGWYNPDEQIIVPYTTAMKRLFGLANLREIDVQVVDGLDVDVVLADITEELRRLHRIKPGAEDDFNVRNQAELLETATEMTQIFTVLLGGIAGISLLVGGIGIMNIMLVTVTERTREIGIRKAIGAKNRDILKQFLIEAVLMCGLGGVMGVVLGTAIAKGVEQASGFGTVVSPLSVVIALSFSAGIGIFFGYYPARKAALLNPIDALRYE